ncbi:MAG: hypothetical protein ACJAYU_001270 [Bradymonadia bacterium]|jgi:hypothetical protein
MLVRRFCFVHARPGESKSQSPRIAATKRRGHTKASPPKGSGTKRREGGGEKARRRKSVEEKKRGRGRAQLRKGVVANGLNHRQGSSTARLGNDRAWARKSTIKDESELGAARSRCGAITIWRDHQETRSRLGARTEARDRGGARARARVSPSESKHERGRARS